MTLHELKQRLAALTIGELEALGVDLQAENTEDVKVMTSSDAHNKKHGEVVWITSINNEKDKVVIIANGMLYTPEERDETGKQVEVGRVYVNREKAEILVEALAHAYPDLLEKKHSNCELGNTDDLYGEPGHFSWEHSEEQNPCGEFSDYLDDEEPDWEPYPSKISLVTSDQLIDTYKDIKNKIHDKLSDNGLSKVTLASFSDGKVSTFVGTVPGSKNVEIVEINVEEAAKNKSDNQPPGPTGIRGQITIRDKRVVDEIVAQFDAG